MDAPTVGVSIELLYCIQNYEEEDFEEVFFSLLKKLDWDSQLAVFEIRCHYRRHKLGVLKGIEKALMQGYSLPESLKTKDPKKKTRRTGWIEVISDFCAVYNVDPRTVWTEYPFAFFLELVNELERNRVKQRFEMGMGVSVGFGSIKEDTLNKWEKVAFGDPEPASRKQEKTDDEIREAIQREYEIMKRHFK